MWTDIMWLCIILKHSLDLCILDLCILAFYIFICLFIIFMSLFIWHNDDVELILVICLSNYL